MLSNRLCFPQSQPDITTAPLDSLIARGHRLTNLNAVCLCLSLLFAIVAMLAVIAGPAVSISRLSAR